jgi:hypothetical protein
MRNIVGWIVGLIKFFTFFMAEFEIGQSMFELTIPEIDDFHTDHLEFI